MFTVSTFMKIILNQRRKHLHKMNKGLSSGSPSCKETSYFRRHHTSTYALLVADTELFMCLLYVNCKYTVKRFSEHLTWWNAHSSRIIQNFKRGSTWIKKTLTYMSYPKQARPFWQPSRHFSLQFILCVFTFPVLLGLHLVLDLYKSWAVTCNKLLRQDSSKVQDRLSCHFVS